MAIFLGPSDGRVLNEVVHLMLVWVVEGRDSHNHFVDKHSKRPPINSKVVTWPIYYLWRKVLGCTAKRIRIFIVILDYLCYAKISQLYVTIDVNQNVFWLEVSVNNLTVVQVSESERNLNSVKLCFWFWEPSLLWEVLKKLAALDEVHDEVDAICSLEHKVNSYDEWVVYLQLYQFFNNKIFDRLLLYHNVLTNAFHSVKRLETSTLN